MRTYYYEFADGYFCYTAGKLSGSDKAMFRHQHGAIIIEKRV